MDFVLTSASTEATLRTGEVIGGLLRPGDVVLLEGQLGTGKTTLAQGIAAGMGIPSAVTSPTFIIVNQYPGPIPLFHIDLYRIESLSEAEDLGLDDYFFDGGVTVVEWPERALESMPPDRLHLVLEHAGEAQRRITFRAQGGHYEALLRTLQDALPQGSPARLGPA